MRDASAEPEPEPTMHAAAPAGAPEPDYTEQLTELARLKEQGILTEDEFNAKKKQILGI
ncbi:MAG TPA: SHOCT domain-containing protein [Gaiellaceae bacterium]|nr:SHOCT domain-containing protein [Gaiellaceae bacterium]